MDIYTNTGKHARAIDAFRNDKTNESHHACRAAVEVVRGTSKKII